MKKLLGIVFLGLLFLTPGNAQACETHETAKNSPNICSYQDLQILLKKYKKIGKKNYNKHNQFDYLLPSSSKPPRTVTYGEVINLIKKRIKEKKESIKYRCDRIAGSANNFWSARKIFKGCVKEQMNL